MELMQLSNLIECEILRRVNRFIVEVSINDNREYVHINNTGRLLEYIRYGRRALLMPIDGKKTRYRISIVFENGDSASIIDTNLQMRCFEIALQNGYLSWLRGASILKRNVKLGSSIIDYLVVYKGEKLFIELKSAVLRLNDLASYPDCPSERGRRQIVELLKVSSSSIIVFIAAMKNVKAFTPNKSADPELYKLLRECLKRGISLKAIQICYDHRKNSISLEDDDLDVLIMNHDA